MPRSGTQRQTVIDAAARLLAEGGLEAVTTRSVSAEAGVQPPTIYRLFGDMRGLIDAVVRDGLERYIVEKRALGHTDDPIADLARGWELHIGFGLAYPAHYQLIYAMGRSSGLREVRIESDAVLQGLVDAVAHAGLLTVEPAQAARMIHAAGVGVTLQLIQDGSSDPLAPLSRHTRDALFAAITAREPVAGRGLAQLSMTLRAALGESRADLTPGEALLLDEILVRLAGDQPE